MENKEYDFLKFYIEQQNHEMRHTEVLRERVTYLIITFVSIISGFIVHNKFDKSSLILAYILIIIGVFGTLMVRKLYMLHQFEQNRVNEWYELLKNNYNLNDLFDYRQIADDKTNKRFFIFSRIHHNWFWFGLNILSSLIGIFLALKICNVL